MEVGVAPAAGVPPELELETTSSIDDPTLAHEDPFRWDSRIKSTPGPQPGTRDVVTYGVASYYGERLGQMLLGAGSQTRFRVRPVFEAGETDPTTEITVGRDFSRNVSLLFSAELRDSQNKTYVLEIHDFRRVPHLVAQVFTHTELERTAGGTVQQTLLFGGGHKKETVERRLRKIRVEAPEELSRSGLRSAIGLAKDDPLPAGVDFDVEVDVGEHLRQRGYPGATVTADVEDVDAHRADLRIRIEPGVAVRFEFVGEKPPPALRRSVTTAYRVDFYETASIADLRSQMVRVLHGQGFLDPQVTVEVVPDDPANLEGDRTVRISSQGGRRLNVEELVFEGGLRDDDALLLSQRLASPAARVELAAAVPEADQGLVLQLRRLGYPDARLVDRRLATDGRKLTLVLEPGERQRIAEIALPGLVEPEVEAKLPVHVGDAPRSELLATASLFLSDELARRGYTEARVRTVLEPVPGASPAEVRLTFEVEPGVRYRLDAVRFDGLHATSPKWARELAGLDEGGVLDPDHVGKARQLLVGTRLFESVRATTERSPEGSAAVTFEVEEADRFRFGYGLRWESVEGGAIVLDLLDRNFLGRGVSVGIRTLYSDDDQAGRLYVKRSNLFGSRASAEMFVEQRHQIETEKANDPMSFDGTIDSTEMTLQLSIPIKHAVSRFYGRWRDEKFVIEDFLFGEPFTVRLTTPILGWQLIWDGRDDDVAPKKGYFASTDLSTSKEALGSDFDFVRLFGQFNIFHPAGKIAGRRLIWAQSVRLGLLESRDEFPLSSELFRAGGEYSVRGYDTDSLFSGPTPPSPFRGGQALLVLSEELRFPIWWELSGVVFIDTGSVWAERGDFGTDLFTASGFGVRANTPVGLLRLDLAFPLDRRKTDSAFKVYVGFGHAF